MLICRYSGVTLQIDVVKCWQPTDPEHGIDIGQMFDGPSVEACQLRLVRADQLAAIS
jgi:hypothetical protein